jgi:hypothetical protein
MKLTTRPETDYIDSFRGFYSQGPMPANSMTQEHCMLP